MNLFILVLSFVFSTYLGAFEKTETYFPFSNDPIDVVIPCTEKDLYTLDLCIDGIRKNGMGIRRVIVVSKNKITNKAEWYSEEGYPFSFLDIAEALSKGDLDLQREMIKKGSRTGWYYQQLLKLYAPLVIPNISQNVLVLDADTIFLNPVTFLNDKNGGLYNPGVEYHPPYFAHMELLVPGLYKLFPSYSGISHHMIFQRPVIEELFSLVESNHSEPFWKTFCWLVERDNLIHSGASEYELYFNYVFSRTDQTSIRKLNWKNIQKLKEIPVLKRQGIHYVSIHSYDRILE